MDKSQNIAFATVATQRQIAQQIFTNAPEDKTSSQNFHSNPVERQGYKITKQNTRSGNNMFTVQGNYPNFPTQKKNVQIKTTLFTFNTNQVVTPRKNTLKPKKQTCIPRVVGLGINSPNRSGYSPGKSTLMSSQMSSPNFKTNNDLGGSFIVRNF